MSRPCARPLSDNTLLEWWAEELAIRDRRLAEEHLLGCDSCSARARTLPALAQGISGLVRSGRIQTVVTDSVVEQMRREGRKIREYRVPAGGGVHCTLAPDDEFLVSRLQASVDPGARLDVLTRVDDGPEVRTRDVPFVSGALEVIFAHPVDEVRARPAFMQHVRLLAVSPEGERVVGEYTFDHTPWPGLGTDHRG